MTTAIADYRPGETLTIRLMRGDTINPVFYINANLTGCTARLTVKRTKTSTNHIFQKTVLAAAMTIVTTAEQYNALSATQKATILELFPTIATTYLVTLIPVTITGADTSGLEEDSFFWDLEIEAADTTKSTKAYGSFEVFGDIT